MDHDYRWPTDARPSWPRRPTGPSRALARRVILIGPTVDADRWQLEALARTCSGAIEHDKPYMCRICDPDLLSRARIYNCIHIPPSIPAPPPTLLLLLHLATFDIFVSIIQRSLCCLVSSSAQPAGPTACRPAPLHH